MKWKKLIPKVVVSLEEAGEELLTFYGFPNSNRNRFAPPMRLSGSTGSFAEESKTQGSLPSAQAAEFLLFGLIISGQIHMRRIDGWQELKQVCVLKAA